MYSKILNLGVKTAGVLALSGMAISAMAQPNITVGDATIAAGGTAEIVVSFENNGDVVGKNFDILYDEVAFPDVDISNCDGNDMGPGGVSCFNNVPGTVTIVVATFPLNPIASTDIGTISFTSAPGAAEQDYALTIDNVTMGDSGGSAVAPDELNNGTITIAPVTAVLNVAPPALMFGNQQTGTTSAPQPITISNTGSDGIDLTVSGFDIDAPFALEGGGTCDEPPFDLADGESCTQHVEFSPTADGEVTGSITVNSDAGVVTNDTVALSGEGVPSDANLVIAPEDWVVSRDIDDGEICLDFTLSNSGSTNSLDISSVSLTGGVGVSGASPGDSAFSLGDDTCSGETLQGGDTCEVEVCFNPTEEGVSNDSLVVTSDANDVSAPLTGEGTAEAEISVNPPFGAVNLGESQAGETITVSTFQGSPVAVTNSGSADAELSCSLTPGTDSAGVFSTSPALGSVNVGAGETVPFSISCALPADADDGDQFSATLSCDVDGEFAGDHELSCAVQAFQPIPINTLQPLGLALFALLMLLMGGISIRLFRAS